MGLIVPSKRYDDLSSLLIPVILFIAATFFRDPLEKHLWNASYGTFFFSIAMTCTGIGFLISAWKPQKSQEPRLVTNVTILVHDVIESAYVKTVTSTGTEHSQDGFKVWGNKIRALQAFTEASATPTAPRRSATPGPYSGWATGSATAGNQEKRDSGVIWIHIIVKPKNK